jgi:hypothetical protein
LISKYLNGFFWLIGFVFNDFGIKFINEWGV